MHNSHAHAPAHKHKNARAQYNVQRPFGMNNSIRSDQISVVVPRENWTLTFMMWQESFPFGSTSSRNHSIRISAHVYIIMCVSKQTTNQYP